MLTRSTHFAALAILLLLPGAAKAQPTTLKLSFFTSDRSNIYQCHVRPLVEAINREGADQIRIEVNFGRMQPGQLKLVLDGVDDIAAIPAADSPDRFSERAVLELPGLFQDQSEAVIVFTRLVEAGALAGFKDFVPLGTFVSAGEVIHSRKPIATLADLRGQTIRVNNEIEAITLKKFGANPVLLPINQTMDKLGQGTIDGVTIPMALLFEFGFGRITANHYLLPLGAVPTMIAMNRAKFESLPAAAQEIIRKYSGTWLAEQNATCLKSKASEITAQLQTESRRKVVTPSQADLAEADKVFAAVVDEWAAQSPRHRELLALVKAEIAKLRSLK